MGQLVYEGMDYKETKMTKPGLSFERHAEIGQRLYEIRQDLVSLVVEIGNAYPQAARFPQAISRAHDALDQARTARLGTAYRLRVRLEVVQRAESACWWPGSTTTRCSTL